MMRIACAAMWIVALSLAVAACSGRVSVSTHPEPDSAVMEPAADGSHWVTPAGTRVYLLHTAGMVCAVAESRYARHDRAAPAISCLPSEVTP